MLREEGWMWREVYLLGLKSDRRRTMRKGGSAEGEDWYALYTTISLFIILMPVLDVSAALFRPTLMHPRNVISSGLEYDFETAASAGAEV